MESNATTATESATAEPAVKLRKVRGGNGLNRDFDRFLRVGEEVEATVELAARCIMGREFELLDEADRPRVNAAIRALGEEPIPAPQAPDEPAIPAAPNPEHGDDPASEPSHPQDADSAGNHAAADPVNVYSEAADAPGDGPELASPDPAVSERDDARP